MSQALKINSQDMVSNFRLALLWAGETEQER
jgi:hypothetical protein